MIPTLGATVLYRLHEQDAAVINRRRADARRSGTPGAASGYIVHTGNDVAAGETYPMIITRVWADTPTPDTAVNGQVLLDGNDLLWVTSRQAGDALGQYAPLP